MKARLKVGISTDSIFISMSWNTFINLPEQFKCVWDPLHKGGLVELHIRADDNLARLVNIQTTCRGFTLYLIGGRIMKLFSSYLPIWKLR